jgi:hypothetical protein
VIREVGKKTRKFEKLEDEQPTGGKTAKKSEGKQEQRQE